MEQKPPDNIEDLLNLISLVYDHRMGDCGPSANGVYWKNADGQLLRLNILLKAIAPEDLFGPITINDLGCGYGALFDLVRATPMMRSGRYYGYDISPAMVEEASKRHEMDPRAQFIQRPMATEMADYSFVSGTYNNFFLFF